MKHRFNVGNNETELRLQVNCHIFFFTFDQIYFFSQIFTLRVLKIKFHTNSSSRSCAHTCGQTDGRTHVTNVIRAFLDYTKAPKVKQGKKAKQNKAVDKELRNEEKAV